MKLFIVEVVAPTAGDFTDSAEGPVHCIVAVSILVDTVNVQLYHKVLPFVSNVQ